MDSAPWTQEFGVSKPMADPNACKPMEKKVMKPQKEQVVNCPRCNSTNTKFCYYNNYSLTQPRYFCKTCRRYWTAGGTLRNVPVGGGSRKNKKYISNSPSHIKLPDLNPPNVSHFSSQNPKNHDQVHDLNLGFQGPHDYNHVIPQFLEFPKIENRDQSSSTSNHAPFSAIDFLRNGIAARGMSSFIPIAPNLENNNNTLFASGFPFQESKPVFSFSINDGNYGNNNNVAQENGNNNGTLIFPFGGMKRDSSSTSEGTEQLVKGQENSNGYWNGMLGGSATSNW